jgi:hypothetical protein
MVVSPAILFFKSSTIYLRPLIEFECITLEVFFKLKIKEFFFFYCSDLKFSIVKGSDGIVMNLNCCNSWELIE